MKSCDDSELQTCLQAGRYVESGHAGVRAFAEDITCRIGQTRTKIVALYYAVRDRFRYDPYAIDMSDRCFSASGVLETQSGFCISKAALLAATARVVGVPARLGFADVKNHLTSSRLRAMMGTDEFVYHGYTELWLDSRWVKATPAFNASLCERIGTRALDFDGRNDSIFQPLDPSGRRFMEYLRDRGSFADVPVEAIRKAFRETYSGIDGWSTKMPQGARFESEAVGIPG